MRRMHVTSTASSPNSGGMIPGIVFASSDLPSPGVPMSSRLWPPAAEISRARLPISCPLTVEMSGQSGAATVVCLSGGV